MDKVNIPTVKLNNGLDMPVLGIGTWLGVDEKLNFIYEDYPKLIETLSYAIDVGYRHIDTAHLYRVEPEIGMVVNKKIEEGVVKRKDLFITTKIWTCNHREADAITSIKNSLRRLNLNYIDQVLIHWPVSATSDGVDEKIDYLETWRGLEKALRMRLTKSIGVSNFNLEQIKRLLENAKVPPACNQVEKYNNPAGSCYLAAVFCKVDTSPVRYNGLNKINLNLGQKALVEYCQSQNIVIVAYTPFGTMIPSRASPNSPEPKLKNPTMLAMSKKHGKTVTQIVLRYLYQRDIVAIPKTVTKSRVVENASIFDFTLDEDDFKTLDEFDVNYRTVAPIYWQDCQNYPFEKSPGEKQEMPMCFKDWKNGINADID